jgi:cyanophycinase
MEEVAAALQNVLDGGAMIVAAGGASPWLCESVLAGGELDRETSGLGLLNGVAAIASADEQQTEKLAPGQLGLCLAEDAVLVVRGRRLLATEQSEGGARLVLKSSRTRPLRVVKVSPGRPADLTALRRAAAARADAPFPGPEPIPPVPASGSLLIAGGGALSDEMVKAFVERAGGNEARIVVIPTAEEQPQLEGRGDVRRFNAAGAGSVTVVHTRDRMEAGTDAFLQPLREATGVWFGGGRQWRFLDAYEETPFVDACRDVLRRGGVIGGSSAGATIQGEYLVRGSPLGNEEMMCEGYERGFGFLPGTAIDQHFTQRDRRGDMELLKREYPQLVGIGIDESTALLVEGETARVLGPGACFVFDRFEGEATEPVELRAGDSYDLRKLHRVDASGKP